MYLEMDEISMVPVMVVRVPVMPRADKDQLRDEIMSGIFDGLLLLEDGLSYEVVDLPLPRAWTPELREPEPPPGPSPEAKDPSGQGLRQGHHSDHSPQPLQWRRGLSH